ncbi:MAG: class B sortase [Eubacteriales bacterium]|nr:class B sortase [Eubacteriales bacterium]
MKKKTCVMIGVICSVLCIVCLAAAFWPQDDTDPIQMMVELPKSQPFPEMDAQKPLPEEMTADIETQQETEKKPEPYISPIDFEKIQNENPDIYAWLDVPDTEISYPLLQKEGDDTYYLKHDSSGAWAEAGAIFTQSSYNGKDFTDPVTVVYGHRMRSGAKFGRLQETFEDVESFQNHKEIVVYLPDRELHFQVFAAVPYSSKHIMSIYDFDKREDYEKFLKVIFDTPGNFRKNISITPDNQLMVLSTCLKWDSSRRYLVLGKLCESDDLPVKAGSHIVEQ